MSMGSTTMFRAACASCGIAVALGAFAAHGLEDRLAPDMLAVFEVGVRYQFYHGLALLACSLGPAARGLGVARGHGGILGQPVSPGAERVALAGRDHAARRDCPAAGLGLRVPERAGGHSGPGHIPRPVSPFAVAGCLNRAALFAILPACAFVK